MKIEARAAWLADGRTLAPACWEIDEGRTIALRTSENEPEHDGVLLPGLVNAHAHLDLAGGPRVPPGASFPEWLWGIGAVRGDGRDVETEALREAEALGRRGVTAIGDIDASSGLGLCARRGAAVAGVSYLEIVGLTLAAGRSRLIHALDVLERRGGASAGLGLSPHAPYSVHERALAEIVRAAAHRRLPLAMHLAESAEETRYLLHGDGPFDAFLERIGGGRRPFERAPGVRPIEYAERVGLLGAGGVVIHGNDLDDDDVARLARHRASVVYCHGTHRYFDRPRHRFAELAAAGVNVALGTDSGSSNEGVDLFGEMRRLHRDRPDVDPASILRAATLGGRRALGVDERAATFGEGGAADAVLVGPAPDGIESWTPDALASWVLSSDSEIVCTWHAGRPRPSTRVD